VIFASEAVPSGGKADHIQTPWLEGSFNCGLDARIVIDKEDTSGSGTYNARAALSITYSDRLSEVAGRIGSRCGTTT
jgi:hypothetical protein